MRTTIFLNKIEELPNSSNSFEWKMKKNIISNLLVLKNREDHAEAEGCQSSV